jgi:NAD(P)-dependent dehydrogenase (short-subunit alcohol dehydrogenase family)
MAGDLLPGESALVTGGASGIGRGIATALAAEGADVVLSDISDDAGDAAAAEIRADGGSAHYVSADLAAADGYRDLHATALETLGGLSLFVHCASPPRKEDRTAAAVTEDEWDAMVGVNLRTGFFLARDVAARMRSDGVKGRMLIMTSLHSYTPRNLPHYSAAKAGQVMVVKELARLYGPAGIRVNGIAPGAIPGGGFDATGMPLADYIPLGRTGTPEDIAGMALALLSDRFSAYVTGTIVAVDGGIALHNWIAPPVLD